MNVVLRDLDSLEHQVALTLNNEQLANIQIKKVRKLAKFQIVNAAYFIPLSTLQASLYCSFLKIYL